MKVFHIEDNKEAIKYVKSLLENHFSEIKYLGSAISIDEAIDFLQNHNPDLLLLDIQIGNRSIFELLQIIDFKKKQLVFMTSHNTHAIEAFKYSAVDYLLKPIDKDEFIGALQKAEENYKKRIKLNSFDTLLQNINEQNILKRKVLIKSIDNWRLEEIKNIIYLKSDGNYSTFFFENSDSITSSKKLKHYEMLLNSKVFFRVHQSYLINVNFIKKVFAQQHYIILKNEDKIPIAQRKKTLLSIFLEEHCSI